MACKGGLRVGTDFSGAETPAWCLKLLNVPAEHVFSCDKEAHSRKIAKYIGAQKVYTNVVDRDVGSMPAVDLYVFSPPCVHCSPLGKREGVADNINGDLIMQSMRYISHHKPLMFIMEEVPEFATAANQLGIFRLCFQTWKQLGYNLQHEILDSSRFGVPQRRKRLYVVGVLQIHGAGSQLAIPMASGRAPVDLKVLLDELPPEKFEIQPSQLGTRQDNVKMHLERMTATGTNPFSTAAIITAGTSTRFCQLSIDIAMTITKAEVAEMFAFPT